MPHRRKLLKVTALLYPLKPTQPQVRDSRTFPGEPEARNQPMPAGLLYVKPRPVLNPDSNNWT